MIDPLTVASILGVAIAIASAVYARNSAVSASRQAEAAERALAEAKRQTDIAVESVATERAQNDINIHAHRLDAYKALLSMQIDFSIDANGLARDALDGLMLHGHLAEFYFSAPISASMRSLASDIIYLRTLKHQQDQTDFHSADELERLKKRRYDFYVTTESRIDAILAELRPYLALKNEA